MTPDEVQSWLDRYVEAWHSNDREQIKALFADDATYRYHPWDEPVSRAEAIADDWLANPDEPGTWEASYRPLLVDGNKAITTGNSSYTQRPASTGTCGRSTSTTTVGAPGSSSGSCANPLDVRGGVAAPRPVITRVEREFGRLLVGGDGSSFPRLPPLQSDRDQRKGDDHGDDRQEVGVDVGDQFAQRVAEQGDSDRPEQATDAR